MKEEKDRRICCFALQAKEEGIAKKDKDDHNHML